MRYRLKKKLRKRLYFKKYKNYKKSVFMQHNYINRNHRIYPYDVVKKALEDYNNIKLKQASNLKFVGEIQHPYN